MAQPWYIATMEPEMLTDKISSTTCMTPASERTSEESQGQPWESAWQSRWCIGLFSRHSNLGHHGDLLSLHRVEREESLSGDIA